MLLTLLTLFIFLAGSERTCFLRGASDPRAISALRGGKEKRKKTFESSSEDLSRAYKSLDFRLQLYRSLNVLLKKLVFFAKNDDTFLENQDNLKESVKRTFESSWWDQGMFFIQIGGQVNRFDSGYRQSKKY